MFEIDDYFLEKAEQLKREKLLAWQDFYQQNNNSWLAERVERQLEKL